MGKILFYSVELLNILIYKMREKEKHRNHMKKQNQTMLGAGGHCNLILIALGFSGEESNTLGLHWLI